MFSSPVPQTKVPAPLREAARELFAATLALREHPDVAEDATLSEVSSDLFFIPGVPSGGDRSHEPGDEAFLRAYLAFSLEESGATLATLFRAGQQLSGQVNEFTHGLLVVRVTGGEDDAPPCVELTLAPDHTAVTYPELTAGLRRWQANWRLFQRLWRAWQPASSPDQPRPLPLRPSSPEPTPTRAVSPTLTRSQAAAAERLVTLWHGRRGDAAKLLPTTLLRRWNHPLLVGPAAAGKGHVCEETVRRLGLSGWLRCDVGSWIIVANRSARGTLEQIERFVASHPDGLVYLSGLDAVTTGRLGAGSSNTSWWSSVMAEMETFLDQVGEREEMNGGSTSPKPLVVLGARFASLWGETDLAGEAGANAWRHGDQEVLGSVAAVAEWLSVQAGLPAGILHRVSVNRPLVIDRPDEIEAGHLARTLCGVLPSALDGIVSVPEVAAILSLPGGWRRVADLVEASLEDNAFNPQLAFQ